MRTSKKFTDRSEASLARRILRALVISQFEDGGITATDILDGTGFDKVLNPFLKKPTKGTVQEEKLYFIIDHRDTIFKEACEYAKTKKYENARIFYALYFEHEINGIIHLLLMRKGISKEAAKSILRLPLRDKLTWVLELLGVKPPKADFMKYVEKLSNERNEYVHYKWTGKDSEEKEDTSLIERANKMAAYIRRYRSNIIYAGQKKQIMSAINKRFS